MGESEIVSYRIESYRIVVLNWRDRILLMFRSFFRAFLCNLLHMALHILQNGADRSSRSAGFVASVASGKAASFSLA